MSDFDEHYNRSLRLALLRLLAEAPAYKANSSVLNSAAASMGFHVSRDKVEGQIDWLKEQSLVATESLGAIRVVTITQRGLDVASGNTTITGVDRPSPKV